MSLVLEYEDYTLSIIRDRYYDGIIYFENKALKIYTNSINFVQIPLKKFQLLQEKIVLYFFSEIRYTISNELITHERSN